ncbi:site-specific DNA-methyltransferase [Gemmatimonas sp.]|uniref:DNA-methyltransferase n=1 Tax=Gemmatimonas sp. TaxID=1962908 RepID=UPI00334042B6
MRYELKHGDCLDVLRSMPESSVDSVVTDPPYGLAFMGKKWDYDVPSEEIWRECLRVLKPGGHLLAFAGTRTQHRMAVRIEDAGFEIRDMIAWVYGSGFPKSLDVSKAIDKAAGAEREVKQWLHRERAKGTVYGDTPTSTSGNLQCSECLKWKFAPDHCKCPRDSGPATDAARQWDGWGTALKPALEPITVARKPLVGTVAANVLAHGTGGINVDGCRVGTTVETWPATRSYGGGTEYAFTHTGNGVVNSQPTGSPPPGRWPANLIHDGSDEVQGLFPHSTSGANPTRRTGLGCHGADGQTECDAPRGADSGSAARFFYCAKASKADRDADNIHPTVKPTALMRYLCRLVTPPNGIVLDPFMGSGSTGKAAMLEGFRFIGIERDADYLEIAKARIASAVDAATSPSNKQQQLW